MTLIWSEFPNFQSPRYFLRSVKHWAKILLIPICFLLLNGCSNLPFREALSVNLVNIEPLDSEGLEIRMLVKLRVTNPNSETLNYNGISLKMDVQGKKFATGVTNAEGSIPGFSEGMIRVPISISLIDIARQAYGVSNDFNGELPYEISGKFGGALIGSSHFNLSGEIVLPPELFR